MSVQQADSSDMARFIYLSDGTKVGAVRGDSQRISYRGSYLLSGPSSLSQAVESVRWAEGVCAARTDGLGMGDYLYVTDHLGNVRSTVALYSEATAAPGSVVLDRSDYLPFGERVADLTAFSLTRPFTAEGDLHRWHLGGKEEVPEGGLNLLDFGARYYDPALCRWTSLDPLSEKYYDVSPYVYCANNPIIILDSDGAKIKGATGDDANKIVDDLKRIFSDAVFDNFRELIRRGNNGRSRTLETISESDLQNAFDGAHLSEDQQCIVDMVVNTINDKSIHLIEYSDSEDNLSIFAESAFKSDLLATGIDVDATKAVYGGIPNFVIESLFGEGATSLTANGSYSLILEYTSPRTNGNRPLTSFHEVIGHGRSLVLGRTDPLQQHVDAIQTENLARRIMGLSVFRDGSNHGNKSIISNYTSLPSYR